MSIEKNAQPESKKDVTKRTQAVPSVAGEPNGGNPSRSAQVAAGDKPTAPAPGADAPKEAPPKPQRS
jgi:hypothetical protein